MAYRGGGGNLDTVFPGSTLETHVGGRFRLVERLGVGGMAEVWRAWDSEVGEQVALKRMRDGSIRDLRRFRREVRLSRRVTHPNVARTHDLGRDGDLWFLTMELVEGPSLKEVLASGPLPLLRAVALMAQVADGLAAAHAVGVVHRDLKPANILVGAGDRAVLTDFGIARSLEDSDATANIGTPGYMAPEQLAGEEVSQAADLYALGLVLYEVLTGDRPFGRGTASVGRRMSRPAPPRRVLDPVPASARDLLWSLLQRDLARRPASAAAVAEDLRSLALPDAPTLVDRTPRPEAPAPIVVHVEALRALGPGTEPWLADALTEALGDVLARTRGLAVHTHPSGAEYVVTGSIQGAGDRIRVAARLTDSRGALVWSDRADAGTGDLLSLQDRLGERIAEELRVALRLHPRGSLPAAASERYLRARALTRHATHDQRAALDELDGLLDGGNRFPAAVALHALCFVRSGWAGEGESDPTAWEAAVKAALEQAPDEPETHVASAMLATRMGRYREGVAALRRALEIAPGNNAAAVQLGSLEAESGRVDQARLRLEQVAARDPEFWLVYMELGRIAALLGDPSEGAALLDRAIDASPDIPLLATRARVALWFGDHGTALACARRASGARDEVAIFPFHDFITGRLPIEEVEARVRSTWLDGAVGRRRCLYQQMTIECLCLAGRADLALPHLRDLAEELLVDVLWLDRCPVLEPIRDAPVFEAARREVRVRAEKMWR